MKRSIARKWANALESGDFTFPQIAKVIRKYWKEL